MRAVFLAMLLGCAPKYDPGSIPVDEARAPVDMVTQLDSEAPNVYLQAMGRTLMDAELAVAGVRDAKAERKQSMR